MPETILCRIDYTIGDWTGQHEFRGPTWQVTADAIADWYSDMQKRHPAINIVRGEAHRTSDPGETG